METFKEVVFQISCYLSDQQRIEKWLKEDPRITLQDDGEWEWEYMQRETQDPEVPVAISISALWQDG